YRDRMPPRHGRGRRYGRYDIPPPEKLPEPGYYYHFKHDPHGPLNIMPIKSTVSVTILRTIAEPKTRSCRYTGRYTRNPMLTGMVGCSTCAPCTCFSNRPNGREKRCRGSQGSAILT